jgi:hypothetical protein
MGRWLYRKIRSAQSNTPPAAAIDDAPGWTFRVSPVHKPFAIPANLPYRVPVVSKSQTTTTI